MNMTNFPFSRYGLPVLLLCSALASCGDDEDMDPSGKAKASTHASGQTDDDSDSGYTTRLLTSATYELAVGFSYDPTADWGKGTLYQIFDLNDLDRRQAATNSNYIADDMQSESKQEVTTADSEEDLITQLQLSGSIGLGLEGNLANIKVTGSYSQQDIESRKYSYGLMRIDEVYFTRNLLYYNIAADAENSTEGFFTPVFRKDWDKLQAFNRVADGSAKLDSLSDAVSEFLDRWGIAFVTRSSMGGYLQYCMTVEKVYLTDGLTVAGALQAEVCKVLEADASISYEAIRRQISGHSTLQISAAGGNVQLVSAINSDQTIDKQRFADWSNSIVWDKGLGADNCVLTDLKLVSIAYLFDGRVRTEMESQIEHYYDE